MIRQPSTENQQFAWWRAALRGDRPPVHEGIPECGFFRTRLVKNGPFVPVRIFLEQVIDTLTGELTEPERYICILGEDERRDAARIFTWLTPITREAYEALLRARAESLSMKAELAPFELQEVPSP